MTNTDYTCTALESLAKSLQAAIDRAKDDDGEPVGLPHADGLVNVNVYSELRTREALEAALNIASFAHEFEQYEVEALAMRAANRLRKLRSERGFAAEKRIYLT